jgi:D-sedoheptulose 7-phosphate isomerase
MGVLRAAIEELEGLLPGVALLEPELERLGHRMLACWEAGGKVLAAGNGGSMADAIHLAEELSVRFQKNRRALAAVALSDASALTCAGNDFGFDRVFSRQLEALGRPGDLFFAFSTSGNSRNIILALETARKMGVTTVGFLGRDGGACRGLCDVLLLAPGTSTARIQEIHQLLYHALCQWIDGHMDAIPGG